MQLTDEQKFEISQSLDQLGDEAFGIGQTSYDSSKFQEWRTSGASILQKLFGDQSEHVSEFEKILTKPDRNLIETHWRALASQLKLVGPLLRDGVQEQLDDLAVPDYFIEHACKKQLARATAEASEILLIAQIEIRKSQFPLNEI